jgi:plasmid stabilization system protein ParE
MRLRFLPATRDELTAAAEHLEQRASGLRGEFVADVETVAALVCEFPSLGRLLDSRHRSIPLRRFAYSLAYRVDGDTIHIVAVAHKRRRPGYWKP